ncbi:MAG: chromate resistance protein [Acidobacteriales bacterium]|nr:chromate resistance protein [Terriglobales bacterium]
MSISTDKWLLLIFSLPASQAAKRVEIWRKLRRYGAIPLPSSGYVLPGTPDNQEKLQWLASAIRRYRGQASVVTVSAFDDLPDEQLRKMFVEARTRDYELLARELRKKSSRRGNAEGLLSRLRRRLQDINAIDFFHSPLRSRVEGLLARADYTETRTVPAKGGVHMKKEFRNRVWVTRPRPGIDRSASAWLIRKFIDPRAKFAFAADPKKLPNAVPFDMYGGVGFGHRGDDCTFETLCKEFGIRDRKLSVVAQIVHDADLDDEKFGRSEGAGIHSVLAGWAQQGIADDELLRRGMELFEGLYQSAS